MANDSWRTPPAVFNSLDREFSFTADMACSIENSLCIIGFDENEDSLSFIWKSEVDRQHCNSKNRYVWCNPPYSNPMPWVKKALEAQQDGLGVVMLLNADDSVAWFYEALKGVSEIRRITGYETDTGKWKNGRLSFLNSEGIPTSGNNKAQFILVFNPFKIGHAVTTYVSKLDLMSN